MKLAAAVGQELVVGLGEGLSTNRSIAKLIRDGDAVLRKAGEHWSILVVIIPTLVPTGTDADPPDQWDEGPL